MPIINSVIASGPAPTGTIQITNNGTTNVADYEYADVQVPTTAPVMYREFQLDANGVLQPNTTTTHIMNFTGVKSLNSYMQSAYKGATGITGHVDLSDVESAQLCGYIFEGCTGITSVDLSKFKTGTFASGSPGSLENAFKGCTSLTTVLFGNNNTGISGSNSAFRSMFEGCTSLTTIAINLVGAGGQNTCTAMFKGCTALTTIDLSSFVTTYSGYTSACQSMFENCTNLTSIDLSKLAYGAYAGSSFRDMFRGCSSLPSVYFYSLKGLTGDSACGGMFTDCSSLTSLYFYAITPTTFGTRTNQLQTLCSSVPNVTLHFPSNVQSVIEGLAGYSATAPFGAVAGQVLFDLPSTAHLIGVNSVEYERNPKYDTATALAWRVKDTGTDVSKIDFTSFYTSGTTDPSVGDTIYSDAACTTAVTTISSIA